jgi:hypothetical protein
MGDSINKNRPLFTSAQIDQFAAGAISGLGEPYNTLHEPISIMLRAFCLPSNVSPSNNHVVSAVLVTPLDVVKIRLQNQQNGTNPKYRGTFPTFALIWREEGLRGLFSGLSPSVLAYIPDRAIWFGVYHACKDTVGGQLGMLRYHSKWIISLTMQFRDSNGRKYVCKSHIYIDRIHLLYSCNDTNMGCQDSAHGKWHD